MTTIQVFDPALCCSTGVCGVEVDQALVSFSADVDWAQSRGAKIERFNLAQQPMVFAESAVVKGALERSGETALPLIVRDGQIVLSGRYPTRDELAHWLGSTDAADAPSIFSAQVAELVAIGAAIAANCEPCLKFHYAEAKKLGVSAADMRRAVDLAQKVKNAPASAMRDLAQRLLEPAASAGEKVGPAAVPASASLAAIAVSASPVSPCCNPPAATAMTTDKGAPKCC
ncbi:MAG: arsenite efflux transporter metallochaperone ArsD [Rubrivivax sp.]|nr:arsenite efflux transporter metallochaperone ArsD [Rubrivivax sp.]